MKSNPADLTLTLSSLEERELFVCTKKYISLLLLKGEGPGMRSTVSGQEK